MTRRDLAGVIAVGLAFLVDGTKAQQPLGIEQLLDGQVTGLQTDQDLAAAQDGSVVATWVNYSKPSNAEGFVRARRLSAVGKAGSTLRLWPTRLDLEVVVGTAPIPAERGFRIFWTKNLTTGNTVMAREFDDAGRPLNGERRISPTGGAFITSAAARPSGGAWITALDGRCCDDQDRDAFARGIDGSGKLTGPYRRVNTEAIPGLALGGPSSIGSRSNGGAVVAWGAIDEPFEGGEIRARLIGPQAGLLGSEIQVNTFTDHQQACPNLGVGPDDGFFIEWLSNQQDGSRSGHYYQRFDAAASRFGVETRLDSNIADADQCGDFAMDPHGNFVAVWTTTPIPSPNCSDVVGRLFRADGTPIGPDFHLAKDFGPCEEAPRVTFGPNGIITAVWQRFNGEDDDLVYARYAASPGVEACVVRGKTLLCDGGRTGGEFEISIPRGSAPTLAGDLDGDGRDDLCTRVDGVFRCDLDHRGAPAELSLAFGPPAGIGLLGDFDGDGQDDPCVVEVGSLLCDLAHDGGAAELTLPLPTGSGLLLAGDLDGDGQGELCLHRAGEFACDIDRDGSVDLTIAFGGTSEQVALADLDGNGTDDPCALLTDRLACDTAHDGGNGEFSLPMSLKSSDLLILVNLDGL